MTSTPWRTPVFTPARGDRLDHGRGIRASCCHACRQARRRPDRHRTRGGTGRRIRQGAPGQDPSPLWPTDHLLGPDEAKAEEMALELWPTAAIPARLPRAAEPRALRATRGDRHEGDDRRARHPRRTWTARSMPSTSSSRQASSASTFTRSARIRRVSSKHSAATCCRASARSRRPDPNARDAKPLMPSWDDFVADDRSSSAC